MANLFDWLVGLLDPLRNNLEGPAAQDDTDHEDDQDEDDEQD